MAGKARVFISCGQKTETHEHNIAKMVKEKLRELEYENEEDWPFVAETQVGTKPLAKIFERLEMSDYFLFIDFKREYPLIDFKRECLPFSVFSHQEYAIARYRNIPIIGLHQKGINNNHGILKNEYFKWSGTFDAPSNKNIEDIVKKIIKAIEDGGWDPKGRNELRITDQPFELFPDGPKWWLDSKLSEINNQNEPKWCIKWCTKEIENRHNKKIAQNCLVYCDIIKPTDKRLERFQILELKWDNIIPFAASIHPGKNRRFHPLIVRKLRDKNEFQVLLGVNSRQIDNPELPKQCVFEPGEYDLRFTIYSDNFSPSSQWFKLKVRADGNLDSFIESEDPMKI